MQLKKYLKKLKKSGTFLEETLLKWLIFSSGDVDRCCWNVIMCTNTYIRRQRRCKYWLGHRVPSLPWQRKLRSLLAPAHRIIPGVPLVEIVGTPEQPAETLSAGANPNFMLTRSALFCSVSGFRIIPATVAQIKVKAGCRNQTLRRHRTLRSYSMAPYNLSTVFCATRSWLNVLW